MEHTTGQKNWNNTPEPIFIQILQQLQVNDVIACSEVCIDWNVFCEDQLLWKHLFQRDYGNKFHKKYKEEAVLKPGATRWKDEYIRLRDHVPSIATQTLEGHTDEVLHVAFSHDGKELISCSRDKRIIVWSLDDGKDKFVSTFSKDMSTYGWVYPAQAQYSPNDTKFMVLGKTEEEGFAELDLAIFSRNVTCDMLCRLKDGNGLHPILQNYVSNIDYPQEPFVHYLSNVITPNGYWYSDDSFLFATEEQNDSTNNMNTSIWTHPIPCLNNETTSDSSEKNDHEKPLITFKSDYSEGWASFTLCTRRKDNTINNSNNNNEVSIQENKQNIESKEDESSFYNNIEQDISSTNLPGKFPLDNCPLDKIPLDNSQNELYPTKDKELLAVTLSLNRISVPNLPHGKLVHQISFNRILSNDTTELKTEEKIPVNVLEVDGVVIGATIDTKHEFLYLNIRNFDKSNDNVNTPRRRYGQEVHEEIQIRRIDLQTLEFEPGVMIIGHKGFTRKIFNGIFRLDIDLSENYISSGSEDSNGYIWDKHYKFLVAKLPHTKCVSCVAFNPIDEETCVSASDDNTLKVWRSSRKQREVHLSSKK